MNENAYNIMQSTFLNVVGVFIHIKNNKRTSARGAWMA